jgi:hypothetical protein
MYWMGICMSIPNETANELPQDMVFRILLLHELGLPQEAIRINLYEVWRVKVSLALINGITDKVDRLVDEWLNRLRCSINPNG